MAGLNQVSIIHGKGTGVLRAGISDLLKRHRLVKSYRLGRYGEGGDRRYNCRIKVGIYHSDL